ncbi:MAG: GGDEF domain-containing protein, partial [Syntrophobacteraceae bacterium CG07_land_8_20_14_0_80_61_8]
MTKPADPTLDCPIGQVECSLLQEIRGLRTEVEQLARLSQTDPLTGLFNFRYLIDALNREMERTRRTGLTTGLIMIDLDHFKHVNDIRGHQVGNRALQWCAARWLEVVRKIDVLCRFGGEEFTVILPATRLAQAVRVAMRLREKLEISPLPLNPGELPLTASFGVDVFRANE